MTTMDAAGAAPLVRPMSPDAPLPVLGSTRVGWTAVQASFETTAPDWAAFDAGRLPAHRYVAMDGHRVVGWVAVSAVSSSAGLRRRGGAQRVRGPGHTRSRHRAPAAGHADLLHRVAGIWTIQSGIFPENAASLALHRAAGFRTVGVRERIGRHHGVWRDVVLLERRSPFV